MTSSVISAEEKRLALQRVLESRAFGRSEQLRAFLRYVCEAEFEGRAHELNEYALGVSVLGRPTSYSPAEDSCVRTRAYELRNKLKSYYLSEEPDAPIHIEIDKGAYIPRFERRAQAPVVEAAPKPVEPSSPVPTAPPVEQPAQARRPLLPRLSAAALVVALLLVSVSAYLLWLSREKPAAKERGAGASTHELKALWKPFLDSTAPLLISFELRLFFYAPPTGLVVRDYETNQVGELAASRPLSQFKERMGVEALQERFDYADSGAVHAVFLLGRLLASEHRDVAIKHSGTLGWEDIFNSNIIFLGKPNLNPSIRYALQDGDFVDTEHGQGIRNLHPLPGEPDVYSNATTHGAGEKYATITVLPGPQPGRTMMILSGSGAELMWALAEAVTNPARAKELMPHVLLPSGQAPAAFQVVISATFESYVPVRLRYVTHRISKAK